MEHIVFTVRRNESEYKVPRIYLIIQLIVLGLIFLLSLFNSKPINSFIDVLINISFMFLILVLLFLYWRFRQQDITKDKFHLVKERNSAYKELSSLPAYRQSLDNALLPYKKINYLRFLHSVLDSILPDIKNKKFLLGISTIAVCSIPVVLALFFHGDENAKSLVAPTQMDILSTITPQPSSTITSEIASSPTIEFTPTIELSFTPTAERSPTSLFTPTVTLPSPNIFASIPHNTERQVATVTRVIDGDTIVVDINGRSYHVRYIGIDTPEVGYPFFSEASTFNSSLVLGKTVTLVKDVSDVDRYDRLLRYVIVGSTFVNYELVRQGFAYASTYPPDVACSNFFASAQHDSQAAQFGFWAPSLQPTSKSVNAGKCDPSYPGVCIAPPPPDLDCKDIPYRRFQVLPPDPHRFDGDGDGIGCESG